MLRHAFMTWSTTELSLDDNLAVAVTLGYDGLEARTSGEVERNTGSTTAQAHGVELYMSRPQRADARKRIDDSGVELCCIATSIIYADPDTNAAQVENTLKTIDLAYDLGCPRIRVFGGKYPDTVSRDRASDLLVSALSSTAGYAQDAGVKICIETHDEWSDPRNLVPVLEKVNHPSVRVNWDIAHPKWRADMDVGESFDIVKPWIGHVHIHDMTFTDGTITDKWIGDGDLDHAKAVELLSKMEYDGYLSGEWINRSPDWREHLGRELSTMKSYELKLRYPDKA